MYLYIHTQNAKPFKTLLTKILIRLGYALPPAAQNLIMALLSLKFRDVNPLIT